MGYKTTEGKHGTIYTIAEGVKIMMTNRKRWQLVICEKGERDRRQFGAGEDELKKAIRVAELYVAKMGIEPVKVETDAFVTVAQVAGEYLSSNRSRWSFSTNERYTGIIQDIVNPAIGSMPVTKVKRSHVKDLMADCLGRWAAKSVEVMHAVLSGIFNEAVDRGYTQENQAHGLLKKLLPPKRKRNQKQPDPFQKADLDLLLETAWTRLKPKYALIIEIMAHTGMRLGECLAMRVEHFDASNRQYMISETMKLGRFGLPKTGKRLIDLQPGLVPKIERHITGLRKDALENGSLVDLLFPGVTQRIVQTIMKNVCRMARLRGRSPHDLRHTYATLLLMAHVSPAYVQKQLGHHSITMTVDTYGHWMPGHGREEAERVFVGTSCQHANTSKPVISLA